MTEIPPPPPAYGAPGMYPGASSEKNSLGTWSLVLGILSILCCGWVAGVPAAILGYLGKQAAQEGKATNGSLANVGFILGIVGSALGIIGNILYFTTSAFDFAISN